MMAHLKDVPMFFVDKPYVSDFLKRTLRDNDIPVVGTPAAAQMDLYPGTKIISESDTIKMLREPGHPPIYTNSENAIGWISENLPFSSLPGKIELFKNKLKFRELIKPLFPDFYFRGGSLEDLSRLSLNNLPTPFIIKPAVGFMSMGVYMVSGSEEWVETLKAIAREIAEVETLYPESVLDTGTFIIEQCIEGEEFAIDAYFDSEGEAVVLNILKHVFASAADVSDRVYISSKEIIEKNLADFTDFANNIGRLADVKNFPVHIELRRDGDGILQPIEVNPMRFGGWCTTADLTYHAYGFNPYLYYYEQKRPDWPELLQGKEGKSYGIVVLDNSTGVDIADIRSFDYEGLLTRFRKPLELRKIDFREYPVFGFLFTETDKDNFAELKEILESDLKEFIC